jgi:hypothetical protein
MSKAEINNPSQVLQFYGEDGKLSGECSVRKRETLTSNPYKLFKLYGKDGTFLGDCSVTKSNWYVRKGLAKLTDPDRIELLFDNQTQTATYKVVERDYLCVSCGEVENLSRYRIVPINFKKWMPESYKSHNSKDVYLLCSECMSDANFCTETFRKALKTEYKIDDSDFIDKTKHRLAHLAQNLVHKRHVVDSIENLTRLLGYKPTIDQIKSLSESDFCIPHDGCKSVAEYIIKQVMNNGQLDNFIERWRDYFMKTMEPEFMPNFSPSE